MGGYQDSKQARKVSHTHLAAEGRKASEARPCLPGAWQGARRWLAWAAGGRELPPPPPRRWGPRSGADLAGDCAGPLLPFRQGKSPALPGVPCSGSWGGRERRREAGRGGGGGRKERGEGGKEEEGRKERDTFKS